MPPARSEQSERPSSQRSTSGRALRQAGAAIKDRALRHLDSYLIQLEQSLTSAGATVHWAQDVAEAGAIVADVTSSSRCR